MQYTITYSYQTVVTISDIDVYTLNKVAMDIKVIIVPRAFVSFGHVVGVTEKKTNKNKNGEFFGRECCKVKNVPKVKGVDFLLSVVFLL